MPLLDASIPDLLRLLVVPVFGWAALRDAKTRRIPNRTWYPLAGLAAVLLAWDGWRAWSAGLDGPEFFWIRAGVSLGFVAPLVLAFWWFRAFGGADAKAFLVVAALFPTFPSYVVADWVLPHQQTALGVFSLTILTNTVLLGALYPLAVFVRNAAAGRVSSVMFLGKPVAWDAVPTEYGRLLETPDGVTRNGVDLDAVRMYLRWRGLTLAELRERPDHFRDPATLPAEPNPPTDGAVGVVDARTDGGAVAETIPDDDAPDDDPWGAASFLDDIDRDAYGATPERLRDGLDALASEDEVWVSPGIPFVVPLFVGTVVALTYGDLLFGALAWLGLA